MIACIVLIVFAVELNGLKIWIPNTDMNNKQNWNIQDTPKNCDNVGFEIQNEIAVFWNLKDLAVTGLTLPVTGDIILSHSTKILLRDKKYCPEIRDIKYIRNRVKGWLDPDNWKSDSDYQWVPHSERVPCAGESVSFPSGQTFAVQLPGILVPFFNVTFDSETFDGDSWAKFLQTELGYKVFKGSEDVRQLPWRTDLGCQYKKKCICGRNAYTMRDGIYKEVVPRIFEEAVCLYAKPKCKPLDCYYPVIPEGHCCGICGTVIKIEDNTEEGLDLIKIKEKVKDEIKKNNFEDVLQIYSGRTKDENIQIVVVAKNSIDVTKSQYFSDLIRRKLAGKPFRSKVSIHTSGLTLTNYIFNNVSGAVFGTLFAVICFFGFIFYIYNVLPTKKFKRGHPFMFVRFDNTLHESGSEENLKIGTDSKLSEEHPQSFDNPMFSKDKGPGISGQSSTEAQHSNIEEERVISKANMKKEYNNLSYEGLEKCDKLLIFQEDEEKKLVEFQEMKL